MKKLIILLTFLIIVLIHHFTHTSTNRLEISAVNGSHIVIKLEVMSFDKPAKLCWKGKGVKIEFHDVRGNIIDKIPPNSTITVHAHVDVFESGKFEIWVENGVVLNYSII